MFLPDMRKWDNISKALNKIHSLLGKHYQGFNEKCEVIICSTCEGSGKITETRCAHYHKSEYHTEYEKCRDCGGKGRLNQTTYTCVNRFDERF